MTPDMRNTFTHGLLVAAQLLHLALVGTTLFERLQVHFAQESTYPISLAVPLALRHGDVKAGFGHDDRGNRSPATPENDHSSDCRMVLPWECALLVVGGEGINLVDPGQCLEEGPVL